MTNAKSHFRKVYEDLPASIPVPAEFQHQRVEVLLLPLEPEPENGNASQPSSLGWPDGFFERTAGQWSGEQLEREPPAEYEERESLD